MVQLNVNLTKHACTMYSIKMTCFHFTYVYAYTCASEISGVEALVQSTCVCTSHVHDNLHKLVCMSVTVCTHETWFPYTLMYIWIVSQGWRYKLYQPVVWWITAGCLLVKGLWSHLKATQALMDVSQASETSHSKSSLGNFHHQYLAELLVNVHSYHLMVKSVSWCCVCVEGGFFKSGHIL